MSECIEREAAKRVMEQERLCVKRQPDGCDRDCAKCDLLLPTDTVLNAYDYVISMLAAQVREVVTCGECKYWKVCGNGCQGWCESTGMFSNICEGQVTMINWFCADGERADTRTEEGGPA